MQYYTQHDKIEHNIVIHWNPKWHHASPWQVSYGCLLFWRKSSMLCIQCSPCVRWPLKHPPAILAYAGVQYSSLNIDWWSFDLVFICPDKRTWQCCKHMRMGSLKIFITSTQRGWRGVYWFHLVRPSGPLWTDSCPLCIFHNIHGIHFIFTHLIKQLQVYRM